MNTINSVGQNLAMDGHFSYNSGAAPAVKQAAPIKPAEVPMADAAQVVQNITNNLAQVKEDAKQLQRLSDVVMGRKVLFSVNQELNQVVLLKCSFYIVILLYKLFFYLQVINHFPHNLFHQHI